jgi:glutaredoxin 3
MEIIVYTTPTCPYCHQVKHFLSERGVKFTERDVSVDRAAATEMIQKTGQRGVPVITIDGQVVVGFDRARLEQLLGDGKNGERPSPRNAAPYLFSEPLSAG